MGDIQISELKLELGWINLSRGKSCLDAAEIGKFLSSSYTEYMLKQIIWIFFASPVVAFASVSSLVENGIEVPPTNPLRRSVASIVAPLHRCSASFLTDTTLLTAGHCVKNDAPSQVIVRIRDASGAWVEEHAKAMIRHPGYKIERWGSGHLVANDFGLIKLRRKLNGVRVRPLRIVDARSAEGDPAFAVRVLGYGLKKKNSPSSVLRSGRMAATVTPVFGFFNELGLQMVPADANNQATCSGDSGGPVILDDTAKLSLVGVHSLSNGCNDVSATSLSALPGHVLSWIWANLE